MKKLNKNKIFERFEKSPAGAELTSALQDIIIFQDSDGTYQLFNKYNIRKVAQYEYHVTTVSTALDLTFNTLKNATAWCIFDKREKFFETRRILELDGRLAGIDNDMQIHQRKLRKATTSDEQLIYIAKITEDRLKKQTMVNELAGYTANSKSWQTKRYDKR